MAREQRSTRGGRGAAAGLGRAYGRLRRSSAFGARWLSAGLRALPDFLVIGAQRGGTTSFYDVLVRHPNVRAAAVKEVHYLDLEWHRSTRWYRAHFPVERLGSGRSRSWITGEATPYYLFHPAVPERARALLPGVRAIALLRDPVERAWSHYRREVRLGRESLSFEEAVEREADRLAEEAERLPDLDRRYAAPHHRYHSYVARGRYAEQLERWLAALGPERLLVLRSEDFYAEPHAVLARATAFLGLPEWSPTGLRRLQAAPGEERPERRLRAELERRFAGENDRLARLFGRDPAWWAQP